MGFQKPVSSTPRFALWKLRFWKPTKPVFLHSRGSLSLFGNLLVFGFLVWFLYPFNAGLPLSFPAICRRDLSKSGRFRANLAVDFPAVASDSLLPSPICSWVIFLWPWSRAILTRFWLFPAVWPVIPASCGCSWGSRPCPQPLLAGILPIPGRMDLCLVRSVSSPPICVCSVLPVFCCPCWCPFFVASVPYLWAIFFCWIVPFCDCSILCSCRWILPLDITLLLAILLDIFCCLCSCPWFVIHYLLPLSGNHPLFDFVSTALEEFVVKKPPCRRSRGLEISQRKVVNFPPKRHFFRLPPISEDSHSSVGSNEVIIWVRAIYVFVGANVY